MATQTQQNPLDEYIRKPEFAASMGVSDRTVDRWEVQRIGPKRVKVGKQILYRKRAISEWLQGREAR